MKKLVVFSMMCLMALSMQAQRCAVLEFKANVGISQDDVDGISAIFTTYFRPAGYTMIERTQIDKVIEEQSFLRSSMTQKQMVRVGEILNLSKIVVGDINIVNGQYNVDVRVINVETGVISATEGATFATSSYRTSMQNVAQKLAAKIAITPGSTVKAKPAAAPAGPTKRDSVEVLYGYLKIFPNELGVFKSEPTTIIAQINKQAMYGYIDWRVPSDEELALMKANNYLGTGEYLTSSNDHGIVLLVKDGQYFSSPQEVEQARNAIQERRAAELKEQGYVDLGLPSGTLWRNQFEEGGYYTYDQAIAKFGSNMPTRDQLVELLEACKWSWISGRLNEMPDRYTVTGPNGNYINIVATGYQGTSGIYNKGTNFSFWTRTKAGGDAAWCLRNRSVVDDDIHYGFYVLLVHNP